MTSRWQEKDWIQFTRARSCSNELARGLGVAPRRINEIVLEKRSLTADTALRLAKYFGMSPQFWLGLQMDHDLDRESDRLGDRLDREVDQYRQVS